MLVAFGVCGVLGSLGIHGLASRFLGVCGRLSYELFLLNGPLLIKYNPLIRSSGTLPLIAQCILFFCVLMVVARLLQRFILLMQAVIPADTMTH